jgi:hypothetical protein
VKGRIANGEKRIEKNSRYSFFPIRHSLLAIRLLSFAR